MTGIKQKILPYGLRHTSATEYYKQVKQAKEIEILIHILGYSDINSITIYITLANTDVENGMKSF